MLIRKPEFLDPAHQLQRERALARSEHDAGTEPDGPNPGHAPDACEGDVLPLANAELVQLQIRVIALENLVIALLTEASDRQKNLVRDMAAYIAPRPGFTPHRLTAHAAIQMVSLVERAGHFQVVPPS